MCLRAGPFKSNICPIISPTGPQIRAVCPSLITAGPHLLATGPVIATKYALIRTSVRYTHTCNIFRIRHHSKRKFCPSIRISCPPFLLLVLVYVLSVTLFVIQFLV